MKNALSKDYRGLSTKNYSHGAYPFEWFTVGYDKIFKEFERFAEDNKSSYPPYNIRKINENKYLIEMAVAGFAKSEIEIELLNNKLVIKGNSKSEESEEKEDGEGKLVWKGIANRAFTRTFTLDDSIEINNAEYFNGMLKIWLDSNAVKEKAKKIAIKDGK